MAILKPCYNCQSVVPPGSQDCPSCGAAQTPSAKNQHLELQRSKSQAGVWRTISIVAAVIAFIVIAWSNMQSRDNNPKETPSVETGAAVLSLPEVTDGFIRLINKHFASKGAAFEILGWLPVESSGVMLEIRPPTPQDPLNFWQAITPADRQQVMTFLSVTYTKMLLEAGVWPTGTKGAFPVMALQYRGMSSPMAVRQTDGQIRLYRSPYDSIYAPLIEQMNKMGADGAAGRR